jgi:hypothetical protein
MLRLLSPKRRLTVLQSNDDPDAPPRPRWQWVVFGALAILTAWLPLAYAAEAVSVRLIAARLGNLDVRAVSPEEQARMSFVLWILPVAALALAASAGGYVLGRWGERATIRQAAEAGALVAFLPVILSGVRSGASWASLAGLAVAVPAAALGAWVGRRWRSARLT